MKNKKRGFTIIELLVVIAIIGLMSAVVLAALSTARMQGRDARRVADLRQLRYALELYAFDHNGKYPYLGGGIWRNCVGSTYSGATGYVPNLAPTYIPVLPTSPQPPADCYWYTGNGDGSAGAGSVNYKIYAACEAFSAATNPFPDPQRPTTGSSCTIAVYTTNADAANPTGATNW